MINALAVTFAVRTKLVTVITVTCPCVGRATSNPFLEQSIDDVFNFFNKIFRLLFVNILSFLKKKYFFFSFLLSPINNIDHFFSF